MLSAGTVIHIKNFTSPPHPPANKYGFVIGLSRLDGHTLFALISTQDYSSTHLARETLLIPEKTCGGLKRRCWIQFFHVLHALSPKDVTSYTESGRLEIVGKLSPEYLMRSRALIAASDVLSQRQIDDALDALEEFK